MRNNRTFTFRNREQIDTIIFFYFYSKVQIKVYIEHFIEPMISWLYNVPNVVVVSDKLLVNQKLKCRPLPT